eukprot:maker-scaffold1088_size63410-snap-gene-0.15 protein:Tk04827 transcript:maker-scaffold1088_size63410-snap-gene-0.15-mRNA-1 annotation:"beta-lactamase-like protein 2 homolog"
MALSPAALSHIPLLSRLSPSVIRILAGNPGPMTLQGTNTYLVGQGPRRILVDTGDGAQPDYIQAVSRILKTEEARLVSVILTHWHPDHVGGVRPVLDLTPDQAVTVYKFPRPEDPSSTPYEPIQDGQVWREAGVTLRALHTPGHTQDHVALHLVEDNALFSGDCVLGEGTAVFEDLYLYMRSLKSLADLGPAIIYPGHGAVVQDPVAKIEDYIQHRLAREAQIVQALASTSETLTPETIVDRVYTALPATLHAAAARNVSHHLDKLELEGRVSRQGERGYVALSKPQPV